MFLLSSAKVALSNMGPRAKPRVFSVSLTQNFQRGRQVWKTQVRGVIWHCLSGRRDSGVRASVQSWRETFPDPAEVILGPNPCHPSLPVERSTHADVSYRATKTDLGGR